MVKTSNRGSPKRSVGSVGSTYWYLRRKAHGRMAQLVEHIVHIDGVTGSSTVATTERGKSLRNQGLSFLSAPPGGVQNTACRRVHIVDVDRLVTQLVHIESM